MLVLKAFGTLDVRSDGGATLTSLLTQSKRAALFTYLVLSRPGEMHRRDALLALFWPELDQTHGRNALSQSLSFLRRELDDSLLVTRGAEEVGVDAAEVASDVRTFEEALAAEDWAGAVEAYGGDLLEGLHVVGAAPFTDWVDRERERLREAAAGAAWKLAHERIAAGELTEAERVAQRALMLVPTDESPVRGFIEALAGAGDRAAALRFYERFRDVLAQELEVEPAPETVAVMEAVRNRVEPAPGIVPAAQADTVRIGASPPVEADRVPAPERKISFLRQPGVVIPGGVVILALVGLAGWFGLHRNKAPPATAGVERSIAVLPFENISPDAEAVEWFVYSVREEVVERLGRFSALTVRPPETVERVYGDGDKSLSEIANELRVSALLVGSVRVIGNRFRVVVRLIDGEGDRVLWQHTYNGDYTTGSETFDTQSDVAERIASALGARPTAEELALVERRPTQDLRALNLYRRGLYLQSRTTPESLNEAVGLYNQAIEEDRGFGEPYAAISVAYSLLSQVERWTPGQHIARVRGAAERALRVDSMLGEPYAILGELKYLTGDVSGGERDVLTALRLDPNSTMARLTYAQFLSLVGRHEEALSQIRRAQEIDPVDPFIASNVGWRYYFARRYREAVAEYGKALELDPQNWVAHWGLGTAYTMLGRDDEAVGELEVAIELEGGGVDAMPALSVACARSGRKTGAEAVLRELMGRAASQYVQPSYIAVVYAGLHENDLAFQWFEKAYRQQDFMLVSTLVDPMLDSLRSDPRYGALMHETGLSDYVAAHGASGSRWD